MRQLMLGAVFFLSIAGPVRADVGLTHAVALAYFPGTADEALHTIAHQRVAEISACGCLEHDGRRAGTARSWAGTRVRPTGRPFFRATSAWVEGRPAYRLLARLNPSIEGVTH